VVLSDSENGSLMYKTVSFFAKCLFGVVDIYAHQVSLPSSLLAEFSKKKKKKKTRAYIEKM
jgi:hypothetical protein